MPRSVPSRKSTRDIAKSDPAPNRRLLTTDLLVVIFSYLSIQDVLGVRKSCKTLDRATRDKLLWVYLLRNAVIERQIPLPPYMKPLASLTAHQLECLARRAIRLSLDIEHDTLAARKTTSLNLPRSVTWLRIVGGRWLFVAASDTRTSTFACWNILDVFKGDSKPLAECFLPGPVHDAEVEVQSGGIVIAISVGSSSPFIDIISLRTNDDEHVFVRLAQAPGCTYVRMLQGDWIGFALKDDISVPHIMNWCTGEKYALGELPDINGAALSISLWREYVVLTRPLDILIYSMPSESKASSCLRTLSLDCLEEWEPAYQAAAIPRSSIVSALNELFSINWEGDSCDEFQILITADATVFSVSLNVAMDEFGGTSFSLQSSVATPWYEKPQRDYGPQWFHRHGTAGRRVACLNPGDEGTSYSVVDMFLPWASRSTIEKSSGSSPLRELRHANDGAAATWGFPRHDFDDALGVFIVGDDFGNITLIDAVEGGSQELSGLSEVMQHDGIGDIGDFTLLSKHPLDITIPFVIDVLLPKDEEVEESKRAPVKAFEDIPATELPPGFSTDWANHFHLDKWQGLPNDRDNLWRLQHLSNIKGCPRLLFYDTESDIVYFKMGGLLYREAHPQFHVLPVSLTELDLITIFRGEQDTVYLFDTDVKFQWPADAATASFEHYAKLEIKKGRDRRQEQVARGGFPTVDLFAEVEDLRPVAPVPTGQTWSIVRQPTSTAYDSDSDSDWNARVQENSAVGRSVRQSDQGPFSDEEDSLKHTGVSHGHAETPDMHRQEVDDRTGTNSGQELFRDDEDFRRQTTGSGTRVLARIRMKEAFDGVGKSAEAFSDDKDHPRPSSGPDEELGAHTQEKSVGSGPGGGHQEAESRHSSEPKDVDDEQ